MAKTMPVEYAVMKIKGRGYVRVVQSNGGDYFNYEVKEFKCVRDINEGSTWDKDPRKHKRVKGYFKNLNIDESKISFEPIIIEQEYMTL